MTEVAQFTHRESGCRMAIRIADVMVVAELRQGCVITMRGGGVLPVDGAWPEVAGVIWPELFG